MIQMMMPQWCLRRCELDTALSVWHCIDAMPTMMLLHDAAMLCHQRVLCTLGWDIAVLRCNRGEHDDAGWWQGAITWRRPEEGDERFSRRSETTGD